MKLQGETNTNPAPELWGIYSACSSELVLVSSFGISRVGEVRVFKQSVVGDVVVRIRSLHF